MSERGEVIAGTLGYATALFDEATIERQRGYLLALLRAMVADAEQPVGRIGLLSSAERTYLLEELNRTAAAYPSEVCIHALFEAQVRQAPDAEAALSDLCNEEARTPFDLGRGPLIRGRLIRMSDEEHVFLLTQHHIVSDGWSMGVLVRELSALYRAFVAGQDDPLPPLVIQYSDYAAWQRQWLSGERLQSQAQYWRNTLAGAPARLALPTDRPRPEQQSFAGGTVPVVIDADLTRELKRLSRRHGTTLFMTVLAAWAAVLSRLAGQDDLVIGVPTANR
ncbi:condensation domain-containing protein, partial [Bradyrhizobium cenepequi]|uniref:condensation domain-containing protein n=1 Tax=Bradyrhizobium cenepequi TaxID=2821403 RepID=UPI0024C084BA